MNEKTEEIYRDKISEIIDNIRSVTFGDGWCQIKLSSDRELKGSQIIKLAKLLDTEDVNWMVNNHGCSTCGNGSEATIDCQDCQLINVRQDCKEVQDGDDCCHCGMCNTDRRA